MNENDVKYFAMIDKDTWIKTGVVKEHEDMIPHKFMSLYNSAYENA